MLTTESLIAAGYREHPVNRILTPYADRFFQRRFRDENGCTSYFLDACLYAGVNGRPDSWACNARLYRDAVDTNGFDIKIHARPEDSVESIEAFIAAAYERLGCVPDAHNN